MIARAREVLTRSPWYVGPWLELPGNLLRSVNRARAFGFWTKGLVASFSDVKDGLRGQSRLLRRAARLLADDAEKRAAFETVLRLGDKLAVRRFVRELVNPPGPPPTEAEKKAARIAGRKARAVKDEAHARQMLADHVAALRREQAAVKRWKKKVRYYDKKKEGVE